MRRTHAPTRAVSRPDALKTSFFALLLTLQVAVAIVMLMTGARA